MDTDTVVETQSETPQLTRPKTVGDCRGGPRPCPWMSCRYNLLLDVDERGNIVLNVPKTGRVGSRIGRDDSDDEFQAASDAAVDMWFDGPPVASCMVDEVGDGKSLEEVAGLLNLTRERVRQIEKVGLAKLDDEALVPFVEPS